MSNTHTTAVRNALADLVVDQLDGGTIVFATSGDVEVATLTFGTPAFGDADAGVADANAIAPDTNATGGTIAKAIFKNSSNTEIFRCTVTAVGNGGDIEIDNLVIGAAQTVVIDSLSYVAPA